MRILLFFTIIASLIACESPPVRRAQLIDEHPEWDSKTVKIIREGFIAKGMTADQVRAAWGGPCHECTGTARDDKTDKWRSWEYTTQVVFFDKDEKVIRWTKK